MTVDRSAHVIAVFGGATAGSVAAEILAEAGCQVVVFDQNPRPYGKVEDGLPRWHDKQRAREYERIDARLTKPGVTFVPYTKLGVDLDFREVVTSCGYSAVILANGAWNDRPLAAEGAEEAVGRGLVYQNPFIFWFNHKEEAAYDGPVYEIPERCICIGGGLASIDVVKILQLENTLGALRARGVGDLDLVEMEHKGIPRYLEMKGIDDPASLGVTPALLVYRRRVEDMPLATAPSGAPRKVLERLAATRQKILAKAQEKYLFDVRPQSLPTRVVMADDRVVGLEVVDTRVEGRSASPVEGTEQVLPAELIVSSIGSIPEPLPGIEMDGPYYAFGDDDSGVYTPIPGVFGVGNVVTGQGNIKVSLDHGKAVAGYLVESYLGIGSEGERDLSRGFDAAGSRGAGAAARVQKHLQQVPPLAPERVAELLGRAAARQREVGYDGDYRAWIEKVTPVDMV